MRRTWNCTDLEFLVLWEDLGEESLPAPVLFADRVQWWDEHLRNKARAREGLADLDPELSTVLNAARTPDIRVEVRGWNDSDPVDPAGSIRIFAARYGDYACLVTQLPGESVRHSAGFTIAEFPAAELASEVVAALPDTAAARGRDIVLTERANIEEVDYGFGLSPAHETFEGSAVDQAAEFREAPAASVGTIDVIQGRSRFGPRGIARYQLEWRDLVDDGRYLVLDETPPLAVPADRKRMITTVESRIAEVVFAIDDERV